MSYLFILSSRQLRDGNEIMFQQTRNAPRAPHFLPLHHRSAVKGKSCRGKSSQNFEAGHTPTLLGPWTSFLICHLVLNWNLRLQFF